jgi:lipid II:glycine glycyltransferase (peptidoglycan interpeptide bridge formation enzyme)
MRFLYTKDEKWLAQWDEFVVNSSKGSHLQLSHWLKSYISYGFDYEVLLYLEDERIIGGFAAVIPRVSLFKFYIVAYGPIVANDNYLVLNQLIEKVPLRAKELKACYCQINVPFLAEVHPTLHLYQKSELLSELQSFKKGNLFKYVFSLKGLNWIDLSAYTDSEALLMDFKPSVRRDIRVSYRKELEIRDLKAPEDIQNAYQLCEANANRGGYSIRSWTDFNTTILGLIENNHGKMIAAYKNGEIKGTILLIKSGNYYTNILGGTVKETPDLKVGYFLQWEALKLSIVEKCIGYNISLGGSKGVVEFKNYFNTQPIYFHESHYYCITNPILFKLFTYFEKYLKNHKKTISKWLSYVKKR